MPANNSPWPWLLLAVLLLGGVGVLHLTGLAPWQGRPKPPAPYEPGRPGVPTTPPDLKNPDLGRYERTPLADGSLLLLDTATGDLYRASPGESKSIAERPQPQPEK